MPSALRIAFDGWDSSDGSGPATTPCAPISARIGAPSSSALARHMTTTAAAPSEIWLAEPAVMVPSGANAGRSLASACAVVPGRTPSSSVTTERVALALRDRHRDDLVVEQPVLARADGALVAHAPSTRPARSRVIALPLL